MDRADLSAAIIQELGAVFMTARAEALPALREADLAEMEMELEQELELELEQHLRQGGRTVFGCSGVRGGGRMRRGAAGGDARRGACARRAQGASIAWSRRGRATCTAWSGTLRCTAPTIYQCAACGPGHAPFDARLGVGAGTLSPGLLRVVCRAGIEGGVVETVDRVAEAVGVTVDALGGRSRWCGG